MKKEIISQYKASLNTLMNVIKRCPEDLWKDEKYRNPYWRIVYHTLFYTSLYLSKSTSQFTPWIKHKENYNYLGEVAYNKTQIIIENIFSKNEMIEYLKSIVNECENSVNEMIHDERSNFEWLPMSKAELHLYNIRHIQHHVGQLIERLHQKGITGIKWESIG